MEMKRWRITVHDPLNQTDGIVGAVFVIGAPTRDSAVLRCGMRVEAMKLSSTLVVSVECVTAEER